MDDNETQAIQDLLVYLENVLSLVPPPPVCGLLGIVTFSEDGS